MIHENKNQNNGKVEIDGKTYQTVAYRLAEFRKQSPYSAGWNIETECLHWDEKQVIFKATIKTPEGKSVATGHAFERWNSSSINRTSAYENAETSAIGRALATAGFIGTEFASADEVSMAIRAQENRKTVPQETGQSAEPESQTPKQAEPGETQSRAEQKEQAQEPEQSREDGPPDEQKAERWARENVEEWLDAPCPFQKAQGRTWRELAQNKGGKIAMKGKETAPRAYLHAIGNWSDCRLWPRMKARIALEMSKNGNGSH
jgi:hypothetical protein